MKYKYTILIILLTSFLQSYETMQIITKKGKDNSNLLTTTATVYLEQNIDDVFNTLTDFASLPKYIDYINKSEIYYKDGNLIKIKVTNKFLYIFNTVNHISNTLNRATYSFTWETDEEKNNDIGHISGGWELKRISEDRTKAIYTNTIEVPSYVPSIFNNYIAKKSMEKAISWLVDIY